MFGCSYRLEEYFHYSIYNTEHGFSARFVLCEQQFRTDLGSGVAWVTLGSEVTPPALGGDPWSPPSLETGWIEIRIDPFVASAFVTLTVATD